MFICQQFVSKKQKHYNDFMQYTYSEKNVKPKKQSPKFLYYIFTIIVVFILPQKFCFCCSFSKLKLFYGMIVKKANFFFFFLSLNGVSYFYIIPPSTYSQKIHFVVAKVVTNIRFYSPICTSTFYPVNFPSESIMM